MLIWIMAINFSALSYQQKVRWTEFIYLFLLSVGYPFVIGIQIFPLFSHTLSLIFLNLVNVPVIVLFYRIYLQKILLEGRWLLSILLLPIWILLYEAYSRISYFLIIHYAFFIPVSYRDKLKLGHPELFNHWLQTPVYTFWIFISAIGFSVIVRLFKKQGELLELQYAKIALELENLRAQVHPHFFFNTLNNLYSLSIQGSPKAPEMIASLSTIMRYVIYEGQDKVPLTKEIEFMENYFELERIRHTEPGLIDFRVQGNPEGVTIEPLLFLPLIENCFKHSLQQDILENPVKIVLVVDPDELIFQTSNKIIKNETDKKYSGIGLMNVKKRLNLLYGDRQSLNIEQESGDFIVTVSIQL